MKHDFHHGMSFKSEVKMIRDMQQTHTKNSLDPDFGWGRTFGDRRTIEKKRDRRPVVHAETRARTQAV